MPGDTRTPQERFEASCERALSYPQNVLRTHKFQYGLKTYNQRLCKLEDDLFHDSQRNLVIWDLLDKANAFSEIARMRTLEHVQVYLKKQRSDARCRFVFLQTSNSRGPMCCTKDQLTYILSYHQVMPSVLEFCFEFISREKPVSTTMFRQEDHLGKRHSVSTLQHHGFSGRRIQHAFNVLGLEEKASADGYTWPLRHATVYHSFEVDSGKSLWIFIKGNQVVQELITTSAEGPEGAEVEAMKTPTGAFAASLKIQLLILEWSTRYWSEYIDFLEYQSRKSSATVNQVPVAEITRNIATTLAVSRQPTMESVNHSRRNTGLSHQTSASRLQRIPSFVRNWSSFSRMASGLSTCSQPGASGLAETGTTRTGDTQATKMRNVTLENIFTFDELQALHTLASEVDKANMVIEQNKRVLAEIRDRYISLGASTDFQDQLDLESCAADILNFSRQIRSMEGDFDNHQTRLKTLLRKMEKDEALFSDVLQYQSMQTGEYLSKSAHLSAIKMEEWTVKMHDIAARTEQETIAMGVITFFTLVLLPSTFVATFFSSGIIKFNDAEAGSSKMGGWAIHRPALNLFLVMSLPLMGITLATWALYRSASFRRARTRSVMEELPVTEKQVDDMDDDGFRSR